MAFASLRPARSSQLACLGDTSPSGDLAGGTQPELVAEQGDWLKRALKLFTMCVTLSLNPSHA